MARIICGNCHQLHTSSKAVFECYRASVHASRLAANVRAEIATTAQARPNQWNLRTPIEMVRNIKSGRYAVQPDSLTTHTFVRVLRPTRGKRKGCIVIDTQHSDMFKIGIIFYPNGTFWINNRSIDQALTLIAVDPVTGARNYGRELNRCSSCGKTLTDERSRWYAIGPECEKHWPEIIEEVDEEQYGPFYMGKVRI